METIQLTGDAAGIAAASELILQGKIVAFPTETVYGLGADATNDSAVRRIYKAKGRPSTNPLIMHVSSAAAAQQWCKSWSRQASALAEAFWPGPLTMVLPAGDGISPTALSGGDTVGLRSPDHPIALQLLEQCARPLAAPSANTSGRLSPVKARHVIDDLGGRIAAVLDGGPCLVGIESTVIDLVSERPCILRPGHLSPAQISEVLGREVAEAADATSRISGEVLRSPGLSERHYAPQIPLRLVTREELLDSDGKAALVFLGDGEDTPNSLPHRVLPQDPTEYARLIYETLWELQECGVEEIWLEEVPDTSDWHAVRDRLFRAAATG